MSFQSKMTNLQLLLQYLRLFEKENASSLVKSFGAKLAKPVAELITNLVRKNIVKANIKELKKYKKIIVSIYDKRRSKKQVADIIRRHPKKIGKILLILKPRVLEQYGGGIL